MNWNCNYRFAHQGVPIVIIDGVYYCAECAPEGREPDPGAEPIPNPA